MSDKGGSDPDTLDVPGRVIGHLCEAGQEYGRRGGVLVARPRVQGHREDPPQDAVFVLAGVCHGGPKPTTGETGAEQHEVRQLFLHLSVFASKRLLTNAE